MPLVKSSDAILNDKCPRCGVNFLERSHVRIAVVNGIRRCESYGACTQRKSQNEEIQRGNRDRFGTIEKNACELIITGRKSGYRKGQPSINVRCYCMAKFGARKDTQFKYDLLGSVFTIEEAKELWQSHVIGLTSIDLDDTVNAKEVDNENSESTDLRFPT